MRQHYVVAVSSRSPVSAWQYVPRCAPEARSHLACCLDLLRIAWELVASVGNRSKPLPSWKKTETREVKAAAAYGPENRAITRIRVPHSGAESHALFSTHRSGLLLWPEAPCLFTSNVGVAALICQYSTTAHL